MTKLQITVTKDILDKSKNCISFDGRNCAISLAIRDIFPDAFVAEAEVAFLKSDWAEHDDLCITFSYAYPLPIGAQNFIRFFDRCSTYERVKIIPFSFEIEIPDRVLESINIEEIKPLLENHPTLKLVTQ